MIEDEDREYISEIGVVLLFTKIYEIGTAVKEQKKKTGTEKEKEKEERRNQNRLKDRREYYS